MTQVNFLARCFLLVAAITPLCSFAVDMPKADTVKGAADHPMLSRFAGSALVGYGVQQFEEVTLPAGKMVNKGGKVDLEKVVKLEGKQTKLVYVYPTDRSALEVMRNYQAALQKAGLKTLFECDKADCGDDFGGNYQRRIEMNALKITSGDHVAPFNYGRDAERYLLATGTRSDGSTAYAAVYVVSPTGGQLGGVFLQIVEPKPMETGKVAVNMSADDMARNLAQEGKVALYGIYFDTDKAVVKEESNAQLAEMVKLLSKSSFNIYVVGHTDNQGPMAHNLALSQQRADAVAAALISGYKVDAKRLATKGVASYAPVASNATEAGRAKNRRVELVQQ
jgi:OmpA-OmpF porin, OOP family